MRGSLSLMALAAALALGACTTVGPDFVRPQVPWLRDWSGGEWRALADAARPRAPAPYDEWWRAFDDPALDRLVAEAQRVNPGVRTAGMRIMEARAQLGIAGSALFPQLQQVTAEALYTGNRGTDGRGLEFWSAGVGFDLAWEIDFWGKFRRGIESADAAYFASIAQYDDLQVLMAAQAASFYATIRVFERRLAITDENAALQQRSLEITERLFRSGNDSELDVQQARTQYLSTLATIPDLKSGLRQAQNALCVLLARPPGALPELEQWAREDPRCASRRDRRPAGGNAAAAPGRAGGGIAVGRPVGADRRQQGATLSVDRARGLARAVDQLVLLAHRHPRLGARAGTGVERLRLWPLEKPGTGAGCAIPAVIRAVPGRRAARRSRARRRCYGLCPRSLADRHPARFGESRAPLA